MEDREDHRSTRRRFLRRLGQTVAIGLGVSLASASEAFAINAVCCPATSGFCAGQYRCSDGNRSCCSTEWNDGVCHYPRAPYCS